MTNNQTKNIIFFSAQTQYQNLGDLIISKILLDNLRTYGTMVIDDRGVPEWFSQELQIKNDERASKYNMKFKLLASVFALKALFQPNNQIYYILNPGHFYSVPINKKDYIKSLLKTITTVIFLAYFKIIGVRVCRFGASIGPFSKIGQIAEKLQAKFMYFYSVRDTKSKDYANKLGIDKVELFPDMAWLMQAPSPSNTLVKSNDENEYVIFSFRESTHALDDPGVYRESLLLVLDEIVKTMCVKNQKKLLISYQVDFDYEFCRDISNRYKDEFDVTFIEKKIDIQSTYDLYSRAAMIFSNRLHVLMFAMVCGSTPVAVVDGLKHEKIIGIFSDAGLMRLVIDISNGVDGVKVLNEIAADIHLIKKDIALCIEDKQKSGYAMFRNVMTGERE